jgi:ornithine cyclodeaminase
VLIIGHGVVRDILTGRERELIDEVRAAYLAHHEGATVVPHSLFLRFPDQPRDRIIALPAYLGGANPAAGIKWIASFPGNLEAGLPRASAAMILNSLDTGRPEALIEGSLISAKRTAASAALAATLLTDAATGVGLVGCGVINLEILRFLAAPHLTLDAAAPGSVVLHVSLRDLTTATILGSRNVVDDADHVCREATSLHLAEQETGGRAFIDASIGELIAGTAKVRPEPHRPVVFSPFGLGVLDIALARFVRAAAQEQGLGLSTMDFLPAAD